MIQGRQWQIRKRKRREWIKRILLLTAGMGIVLCMEQGKRLWDGISAQDTVEAGEQEAVEASAGLREEAPQEAEDRRSCQPRQDSITLPASDTV